MQDHFAEGWRRVAARFARAPRMAGYDILNEPWPGSAWPSCANTEGCPPGGFDSTALTAFHNRVIAAIRKADRRHTVYYEPNLQFDVGAATTHGKVDDPNVGFSFHNYCLGAAPGLPHAPDPAEICKDQGERRVFQNAEDHVEETGATLLMTEFGDVQDATIHRRVTELADEFMTGWTVWGWFRAAGQIKQDPAKPPTRDNLNMEVLRAVVRPYPRIVAGTPKSFSFDPGDEALRGAVVDADAGRAARGAEAQRGLRAAAALRARPPARRARGGGDARVRDAAGRAAGVPRGEEGVGHRDGREAAAPAALPLRQPSERGQTPA